MKSLVDHLALYQAYHRNKWNVLTHFFGIPAIIYGLFIALGWLRFTVLDSDIPVSLIVYISVILYYLSLDIPFGLGMIVALGYLFYMSEPYAVLGASESLTIFLIYFIGGWILQFIGHLFEGRQPAFLVNLNQLLIGPLYLLAKAIYFSGFRKDQKELILKKSESF